ncbi:nitrile hydratase accessory protein [Natronorarus salvus]|uniref:nitrile hydratase accessory protein n=1 Tax=Natronorarus salvus TaxID=3117733 RepID=UPI002F2607D2
MNEDAVRATLEELVDLPNGDSDRDVTFDSPAQARAFSLVVALTRTEGFEFIEFQRRLVNRISEDDGALESEVEETYYAYWVDAAESLLVDRGHVSSAEIEKRTREFAAGDRDASEFIIGDREH